MPGMMDTILNLGLNEEVVEVMSLKSPTIQDWLTTATEDLSRCTPTLLWKSARSTLKKLIDKMKEEKGVTQDVDLTADDLKELAQQFKAEYKAKIGEDFPYRS